MSYQRVHARKTRAIVTNEIGSVINKLHVAIAVIDSTSQLSNGYLLWLSTATSQAVRKTFMTAGDIVITGRHTDPS